MSIPRVKTCSSDTMNEIGKPEIAKPATRKAIRPSGVLGVKSKIPKHEKTASAVVTTSTGEASVASKSQDNGNKRGLENQFNIKRKRYATLRKEIDQKEKCCLTMYEEIQELREKMMAAGGKDPVAQEMLQAPVTPGLDLLTQFETSLSSVPDTWLAVCHEALEKRNAKLLSWIETLEKDGISSDSLKEELTQRIASFDWNEESAELSVQLREQVQKMSELVQRLRLQLEQSKCGGDSADRLDRVERERGLKARTRVKELETQLRELQEKLKQKETSFEFKSKELLKCQKNNEAARGEIAKVDKQRENQESKLAKLRQELESKDKQSQELIAQYNEQIQHLQLELEDERNTRQELQSQFDQFKARNEKLEEKCQQLLEIQEKERHVLPTDDQHTEYEIQLFNELRETQQLLAEKSEIIQKLEAEREQILAAMNAEDETGKTNENSRERLTAELLTKSDELQTLRNQFNQVQKNYKRMQQRAEYLEEKLTEMNKVQNQLLMKEGSGSRAVYGAQVIQLQQQVTDLRSSLAQVKTQNADLEKTCTKLQLKLERYKRHIRKFDEDRKLRKEMQMLLQHKDADVVGAETHFDVQNTADDIEELHEALEKKELQVMKLEKLVKQMEKQEECSQVQRTRLENRIAKLELELKEAQQTHRNRGFSFL